MIIPQASDLSDRFSDEVVHRLSCGHVIVADRFHDPVLDRRCCLVEYLPADLISRRNTGRMLTAFATERFPDCDRLIVRLPELRDQLEGFLDHLYYIRFDSQPEPYPEVGANPVTVRVALPEDHPLVAGWLALAFTDAATAQAHSAVGDAARQAMDIMEDPMSVSLVAVGDGTAIGHVTLLDGRYDALSERYYVELLDMLIEKEHPRRREAEAKLVRGAVCYAAERHQPLIGHIVCYPAADGGPAGARILAALSQRGWTFDHKFQALDLGYADLT